MQEKRKVRGENEGNGYEISNSSLQDSLCQTRQGKKEQATHSYTLWAYGGMRSLLIINKIA